MAASIRAVMGDITQLSVDAIVNAANERLLGGGGVDGAIHRAAGPSLLAACRKIDGCRTGDAVITPGFDLPARFVIHTVGPVWHGGQHGEVEQLRACYRRALQLAEDHELASIAFPGISTGVYGFPVEPACQIAVDSTAATLQQLHSVKEVIFCCFSQRHLDAFEALLPAP